MKKEHSRQWPFLRITIAFIYGILIERHFNFQVLAVSIAALSFAGIVVLSDLLPLKRNYFLRHVQGAALLLLMASCGSWVVYHHDIRNRADWVGNYKNIEGFYCRVLEPLQEKAKTYKAEAEIIQIKYEGQYVHTEGTAIIYFKKSADTIPFRQGEILYVGKQLNRIKGSSNPGAFNYAQYCGFRNIYHQVFVDEEAVTSTGVVRLSVFEKMKTAVRAYVLSVLQKNIRGADEKAIAEALIIGYRNNLDKDLVQAYSNTGVVHIIAISGLHLGIIFGMMQFFFRPFKKRIFRRLIAPAVTLSVIWMFAFVAGGAPSVLRAAVMFSIFTVAGLFSRRGNIFNTLACSAFLLLAFDPFALWDVGFQLSYAAVFSIVLLQRPIYNAILFTNPLIDAIWKLSSVTLAAQVFTTPIVMYHFHQIPTLFLIANLVAVPLAGIILMGEILLVVIGATAAAPIAGTLLSILLKALNVHILRLNNIPFKVIDSIQINIVQAILLMLVIVFIFFFLQTKKPQHFTAALSLMLICSIISTANILMQRKQDYITVYEVPGHSAFDIISNGKYHFFSDTALIRNSSQQNFHLTPSRIAAFSNTMKSETALLHPSTLKTANDIIFIANGSIESYPKNASVVILSRHSKVSFDSLAQLKQCKYIVADASSTRNAVLKWKKEAGRLNLRFHAVTDAGAWKLNL